MTLYVEIVDYMPAVTPAYGMGTVAERWDLVDTFDLPAPMVAAILALATGPEGDGACSMPGCDDGVGWYLDEADERPRAGWRFTALVWDDAEIITRSGPTTAGTVMQERTPQPVLTLCEDHAPADPYATVSDALRAAEVPA